MTASGYEKLKPAGVECPAITAYIDTVIAAALNSNFGRAPVGAAAG